MGEITNLGNLNLLIFLLIRRNLRFRNTCQIFHTHLS